jgi:hypothetical protein
MNNETKKSILKRTNKKKISSKSWLHRQTYNQGQEIKIILKK